MSWQQYVDEHLMCEIEGQHLTSAAIVGLDGSVWAQSATFPQLKPEEVTAIVNDFNEPGSLAPTGLFLGGAKHMVIQGEPGVVIRGKKVGVSAETLKPKSRCTCFGKGRPEAKGTGGACVKKTNMALIIGIYEEPMTPGQCNMVVERLGDYLIEQGY